jgi:DNA end-binding protein Ku
VVVPREEIVKGYEFARDQYVVFSPDEPKALEEAGSHAVEIAEFVPLASVDPVYFDKAYYLAPDKGGAKPYALFARALRDSQLCALGRWASHGKQRVVMLRPIETGLVMQQLLFAAEVRPIAELDIPAVEVKEAELKLARQLIDQESRPAFDPAAYTDAVRARIEAAVEKKVAGQEIAMPEEPAGAQVIDLMAALRESLKRREAAEARPRKPAKRAA